MIKPIVTSLLLTAGAFCTHAAATSYFTDFGTDSGSRSCNYDFGLNLPTGAKTPKPYTIDFSVNGIVLDPNAYGWMAGIIDIGDRGALPFAVSNDLKSFWTPRYWDSALELANRESYDHWSTIPKTEFRMTREDNSVRLFLNATGLIGADMRPINRLYFTLRYFDNAAEPIQLRIAKVGELLTSMRDRTRTAQIGVLAPLNDLRWRTVQFVIEPAQACAYNYNGTPVFQLTISGTGDGNGENMMGNLGLDMAKLSDSTDISEFPADAPVVEAALPRVMPPASEGFVDNDGKAFFPIECGVGANRAGSWTSPTVKNGTVKSAWEFIRDVGINTTGYWNYNADLWNNDAWNRITVTRYGKQWTDYMDNVNTYASNGGPGLWALLDHCNVLGLKVIVDITEKFRNLGVQSSKEGYRTSPGALTTMMALLAHERVKNSPATWAVYPFDEYAHDAFPNGFISVPEATHIRNALMRTIPGKYTGAIHMMYETTPTPAIWGKHAFDFNGCDYYPFDDGYNAATDSQNFDELIIRINKVRSAGTLNLPYLRFFTANTPDLNPQGNDLSSEVYIALTQEVDGLAFYGPADPDYDDLVGEFTNSSGKTVSKPKTAIWKRAREILTEVHQLTGEGVADAVLHKQEGEDISTHATVTGGTPYNKSTPHTSDHPAFIYKRKFSNNARYLICTRVQNKRPTDTVYDPVTGEYTYNGTPLVFTHIVDDMPAADTTIQVLFENRTITPTPYGANGLTFTDGYESRGRHVYKLVPKTVAPDTFEAWVSANFTAAEQANSSISGPDADPDACGLSNLARYGFGLAARGPVANPATAGTTTVGTDSFLTLTFPRRTNATGLTYVLESSTDLVTWTTVAGRSYTAGSEPVTAQDAVALGSVPRRFLRVRVTQQ